MISDDNSREILKNPQSAAEVRIRTLTRAKSRLEAVIAHKLNLESAKTSVIAIQPEPVITNFTYTPPISQEAQAPQPETNNDLNIAAIRFSVEQALREHIETIEDVSA